MWTGPLRMRVRPIRVRQGSGKRQSEEAEQYVDSRLWNSKWWQKFALKGQSLPLFLRDLRSKWLCFQSFP